MSHDIMSPIPLSDIESILAWVDKFKLSRVTKKINRDFSDAVLLAEILAVHYPKLVEMHNYPPRNSHSLKLNNWMTLNRKVLKKIKLNLCCNTMEQLADSTPGVIERVLVMVRDKIRRDEELNKSAEKNLSSGGSYYETCGEEDNVLVVPVKMRVNGVLETIQQKVVSNELYCNLKEELKDAKESADVLKQKVEHLDSLLKLKDERIDELQRQLERKQARRKEVEVQQNPVPILTDTIATSPILSMENCHVPVAKVSSLKTIALFNKIESSKVSIVNSKSEGKMPMDVIKRPKPSTSDLSINNAKKIDSVEKLDREKSDSSSPDYEDYKDSVQDDLMSIEVTIQNEINELAKPQQLA